MKQLILFVLIFASLVLSADPPKPTYSNKYHTEFIFSLPYAGLNEPYVVDFDETKSRENINIYNGLVRNLYLYDATNDARYEIIITQDKQSCFKNPVDHLTPPKEAKSLTPVIPDLTDWTYTGAKVRRGIQCNYWSYQDTQYNTTSYYEFYAEVNSNQPVQYWMTGVDVVFGSHYDEYILDYYVFQDKTVDESAFVVPDVCKKPETEIPHVFGRNVVQFKNLFPKSINKKANSRFDRFMSQFGKKYNSREEYLSRKNIFENNMKKIEEHNSQNKGYSMKMNKYADLSFDEFRSLYLLPTIDAEKHEQLSQNLWEPETLYSLPETFDWRKYGAVSPIKDQATCGSCYAFSVIGALEGQHFLSHGKLLEFSEQNVIDCMWNAPHKSWGCDGSEQWKVFDGLMNLGGIMSEEDYPYLGVTGYCGFDKTKKAATIHSYYNVSNDEQIVMQALYQMGPLAVSYDVVSSNVYYSGGYYEDDTCSKTSLNHAVLMVGWGNYQGDPTKPYWLIKNSWSTHWGDEGYMYISRKNNDCGFTSQVTYPILNRD
ncbi:hypothetical protein M0813_18433 [Anaeramoeba flamelloides]|uniref:Uncharacterized protein n=1 Tax=Anaeramoeba flamelloides TaxID=1746091 RepID=A0ABQ8YT68_9EUKA|nr:hypothetical protein M0813_18433 [Anaeramoeba flamelloides]